MATNKFGYSPAVADNWPYRPGDHCVVGEPEESAGRLMAWEIALRDGLIGTDAYAALRAPGHIDETACGLIMSAGYTFDKDACVWLSPDGVQQVHE